MVSEKVTVRCDVPGCKSYCEPGSLEDVKCLDKYLSLRGWHTGDTSSGKFHLCPAHPALTDDQLEGIKARVIERERKPPPQ